ncbi:MAG TPA: P-type DNA transfer ATPase VirB11 [Coxiellaceae bacterium]|nr:P-type DNA transfer ATPase VirB11 [Coxiellaceae bacterium]
MVNTAALEEYLKPLEPFLNDPEISEILVNQPEIIFFEKDGCFNTIKSPELSFRHLMGLATLMARFTDQRLSEKEPLLSGQLPSGHRIQIVLPLATRQHTLVLSIRKQTIADKSLYDFAQHGVFKHTRAFYLENSFPINKGEPALLELFNKNEFVEFLKLAIQEKKNILISGATSTGKTTFLNACLKEIPQHEHLITLEDVPELKLIHPLHTSLFSSKGLQSVSQITMQDLVQASLRLRPDRIIMGELRGAEAADFIHATATGHEGSLSSIHATNPSIAFMRLVHMVKLSGTTLSRQDILDDLHSIIDIVIQLKRRREKNHYVREVSDIYYREAKAS